MAVYLFVWISAHWTSSGDFDVAIILIKNNQSLFDGSLRIKHFPLCRDFNSVSHCFHRGDSHSKNLFNSIIYCQ
jgi:hypothetical protein